MAFNIKPTQKREIADKMLVWLREHGIQTCSNTHDVLSECAVGINEHLYDVWKGYDLLRILGRLELNIPTGRKGFKVLDYSPLFLPAKPAVPICDIKHCPILKKVLLQFPELDIKQ
jgi:hypothetical protein